MKKYINKNLIIYYTTDDEECLKDIENAIFYGLNKSIEFLGMSGYNKEIQVRIYSDIEKMHLELFNQKL